MKCVRALLLSFPAAAGVCVTHSGWLHSLLKAHHAWTERQIFPNLGFLHPFIFFLKIEIKYFDETKYHR
jgi:hypothetical protein